MTIKKLTKITVLLIGMLLLVYCGNKPANPAKGNGQEKGASKPGKPGDKKSRQGKENKKGGKGEIDVDKLDIPDRMKQAIKWD